MAVRSLARVGTPAATAQLEQLVNDKDPNVSSSALMTLAQTSPDKAAALADRAMKSDDKQLRSSMIQTASNLPPETARRVLLAGVKDSDPGVVESAISQLAQLGGPEAQRALLNVIMDRDANKDLKRAAAQGLDDMGGAAARDNSDLIKQYKDEPSSGEDRGETIDNVDFGDGDGEG